MRNISSVKIGGKTSMEKEFNITEELDERVVNFQKRRIKISPQLLYLRMINLKE